MSTNAALLHVAIYVPFLAALFLFCLTKCSKRKIQAVALVGFVVPFVISLTLWFYYFREATGLGEYTFYSETNTGLQSLGISLKLGLNGIAMPLYLLAGIVGLAAGLYGIYAEIKNLRYYLGLLLVMQSGLMGMFASVDLFYFYFFHEFALIPTFLMIGYWGGLGRRAVAMELTVYLTVGAMVSLAGLIAIYLSSGLDSFDLLSLRSYLGEHPLRSTLQQNLFGLLLFGFGVLVSLWPFHSWAPRGYGAAPVSVAMLHAGVLKKFGLYGLIQIALPLLPLGACRWASIMAWLALCNITIIGLVTIAQRDLKQMIGFSSVMHMGVCFLGIAASMAGGNALIGIGGVVLFMFGHGLSVAILFLLSEVIYKRTHSYDMRKMGGLCSHAPILAGFFVAASLANVGLPGFANFWGELLVLIALWQFEPWMVFAAASGLIISAVFGMRAVARIFFGTSPKRKTLADIHLFERIPVILLFLALIFVGFWPRVLSDCIGREVALVTSHSHYNEG